MSRFQTLVICIVSSLCSLAHFCVAQENGLADFVKNVAGETIDAGRAVGISVGVAKGDDVLLAEGYGLADLEFKTPATADTVYRIGSITKQFTATAILQLAEREQLAIDDELTKHLTEYPPHDPPITLRHLLHHTSGLQSLTDLPSYRRMMRMDATRDQMIARFKDLPFHFEPGEKFRYCNSGYFLLGVVVESASGKTYEEFLAEHLFKPLKLEHTFYDRAHQVIPNRARGYRRGRDGYHNAPYVSMTQPFAAGALASTVTDLIRWQRGLVNHKVLNAESYQMMITRGARTGAQPIDYGMGVFLRKNDGRQTITHGGGINGFRSDLTYYPMSDHTIVVLTNSDNAKPGLLSRRIARYLFKDAAGKQE